MKFLDRFKRKPPTEPPLPAPKKAPEAKGESKPAYKPDTKGYASNPAPAPAAPLSMPGVSTKKSGENDLRLELGDFLHRIPAHLLLAGPHDLKAELRFDIGDLSERIAKGQTTISLSEIYRRVPTIFRREILESDNIDVRFPWQKLAKLVNIPNPAVAATEGASPASALAEKLRAKKPDRAIKTPGTSADSSTPPAPVLPGRGGPAKGASWFSKADAELPLGMGSQAPAVSGSKSADMSSVPPPPLKVQPASTASRPDPEISAPANQPGVNPKNMETTSGIPQQVALPNADLERQVNELAEKCRAISEAHDKANAEVALLRVELDERLEELAKEQSSNSMAREFAKRHQQERDEYQAQIDVLTAQLEGTGTPMAASLDGDERIAGLTQERDALLQQKAYLSSQLAEMTNRRSGPPPPSPNANSHRQVEELQRRILLLESAQKEAAQELQREKEAKGKAEKLLANADRLQRESALHMEEAKITMRKDLEASFRKQIKELEDRLHSKTQEAQPSPTEESGASAFQSEAIAQLEADIVSYRERLKVLIRERDEARASMTATEPAQSDMIALQEELTELRAGTEQMAAEVGELRNENAAFRSIHSELENSRNRIAQVQLELSNALEKAQEADALRMQLSERDSRLGNLETARSHANNLTAATVSEAREQMENVKRQLEQQAQDHAGEIRRLTAAASTNHPPESILQDLANLRADHAQTSTLLAEVHQQLESARQHIQKQAQEHGALMAEKDARIRELLQSQEGAGATNDALSKMKADFENEIARWNEERAKWELDRTAMVNDQQALRSQLEAAVMARDDLANDLRAESLAHEELLSIIDKDSNSVVQANEQLVRQLAAAEEARRELEQLRDQSADPGVQAENARLRSELEESQRARNATEQTLAERTILLHENEATLVRLTAENQQFSASMQEFEHVRNTAETSAAVRIQELESERTQLAARLAEAEAGLTRISSERQTLADSLSAFERQNSDNLSQLTGEREQLQAQAARLETERDMLAGELSVSRKQHQQLIASLDNERGELVTGREAAEQRLVIAEKEKAELEARLREAADVLEDERQKAGSAEAELHSRFNAQAAEIEQRHASAVAKTQAELDTTLQLLSELRTASAQERDSHSAKQSALEANLETERAEFERRLAAFEQERSALQSSLAAADEHERTIATLRADREQTVAMLSAAERNHANAIVEIEQRFRDGMSAPAREVEQLRITSDTLRAELLVARKMQVEIVGSLERDREQHLTARAEWDKRLESVDEARRQMSGRLDEREQAIRLLEEKLAQSDSGHQSHHAELSEMRSALETARLEGEAFKARATANELQLRDDIAAVNRKIGELIAEQQQSGGRSSEMESKFREERERIESEFLARIDALTSARDAVFSDLEAERSGRQDAIAGALKEHEEALKTALTELARIEQELARTRDQRETVKREKDELARRIAQITDQQKRMLDDMSTGLGNAPVTPPRVVAQPAAVFEVSPEEANVSLPRIRPVQVRPPQVKIL